MVESPPRRVSQYAAVIVDMDGVIVDSEPLHEKAQRVVFERFQIDVPDTAFRTFKGMTEAAVFECVTAAYVAGSFDVQALIEAKHIVYRSLIEELQLVPGALCLLKRMHRKSIPLGLVTSATREDQERAFSRFSLKPFFNVVVTAADVSRPKPDPEPYQIMASRLGAPPRDCIVIEDSLFGIQAGICAGCRVYGVATSFSLRELAGAGAHRGFASMSVLSDHLFAQAIRASLSP